MIQKNNTLNQKQKTLWSILQWYPLLLSYRSAVDVELSTVRVLKAYVAQNGWIYSLRTPNWEITFKQNGQKRRLCLEMRNAKQLFSGLVCHAKLRGGGRNVVLEVDVMEGNNLPLLISKKSTMVRASATLEDFANDRCYIFGKVITLKTCSSGGHYLLELIDKPVSEAFISSFHFLTQKEVVKLHHQFRHCSENALNRLLKSSN